MADRKRSPVWNHFAVSDNDESFAICKHCKKRVPRGGKSKKSYNTTNLVNHLKEHRDFFKASQTHTRELAVAKQASRNEIHSL